MGFLFNKNKEAAVEQNKTAVKPSDDLVKVLDESVWESVLEDLKANKQFIIKDENGRNKYVAFLLDTMQFGGLAGKDAKKDESKGSIVEAIKTGRIKTYLRTEMLFEGTICVIPDLDTIENMDEFNLFGGSEYVLCTVDNTGAIVTETVNGTDDEDDPEVVIKFDVIRDLVRSGGDVHTLFNRSAAAPVNFDDDSDLDSDEDIPDDPESAFDFPQAAPVSQSVQSDEPDYDDAEDITSDPDDFSYDLDSDLTEDTTPAEPDDFPDNGQDDYLNADTGGYDEYEDVSQDVVQEWVVRQFYSDDLGLEISTQPFDAQFLHGNAFVPFNENRGEGWLNEYLSNLSKDANADLERMHSQNLFRMRERYMRLIQNHCATIAKTLDCADESSHYGKMRVLIENNRDENLENVDSAISAKRDQLETAWNEKLNQVAEAAAAEARQQYIDRFSRTHENDLLMLESREKDLIESDYQACLHRMHEDRRAEATKLLDMAVNETLSKMASVYAKILADENKAYEGYQARMNKFIDENRKDEKARIEALAEDQRQTKKANEVRGEYISKMQVLQAECEMRTTVLQADIDRLHKEHEDKLSLHEHEWESKVRIERERADSLQKQLDVLLQQYKDLDERKDIEYSSRIQQLQNDNASRDAHVQHIVDANKKSRKTLVGLIVAVGIIGVGVGLLISGLASQKVSAADLNESQAIVETTDQDEPETEYQAGDTSISLTVTPR